MENFDFIECMKDYYDDKDKANAIFLAGCLDEMRHIADPKNTIRPEELQAMYQYLLEAMGDDQIKGMCPPERFAYMMLKAFRDGKIGTEDLVVGNDETLNEICRYDQAAKTVLS